MNILSILEPLLRCQRPQIRTLLEGRQVLEGRHISALIDICYDESTKYYEALTPMLEVHSPKSTRGQAGKHVLEGGHLSALGLVLKAVDICYNEYTKYFGALTSMPEALNPKSTRGQAALKGRHVLEGRHFFVLGPVLQVVDICSNEHTKYFGALTPTPEAPNPKST